MRTYETIKKKKITFAICFSIVRQSTLFVVFKSFISVCQGKIYSNWQLHTVIK